MGVLAAPPPRPRAQMRRRPTRLRRAHRGRWERSAVLLCARGPPARRPHRPAPFAIELPLADRRQSNGDPCRRREPRPRAATTQLRCLTALWALLSDAIGTLIRRASHREGHNYAQREEHDGARSPIWQTNEIEGAAGTAADEERSLADQPPCGQHASPWRLQQTWTVSLEPSAASTG